MRNDVTKGCYSNLDVIAAPQFELESRAYSIYIDNYIYIHYI